MVEQFNFPSDEVVSALKDAHGELHQLEANGLVVIVRKPSRGEYKRFMSEGADDRKRVNASENLVRTCVVWPERKVFDQMLEEFPGLAESYGFQVLEMAGAVEEASRKKL